MLHLNLNINVSYADQFRRSNTVFFWCRDGLTVWNERKNIQLLPKAEVCEAVSSKFRLRKRYIFFSLSKPETLNSLSNKFRYWKPNLSSPSDCPAFYLNSPSSTPCTVKDIHLCNFKIQKHSCYILAPVSIKSKRKSFLRKILVIFLNGHQYHHNK